MEKEQEQDDSELMKELVAGRDDAMSQLMTRWQGRVRAFIARTTGDQEVARDLAQETFVRVYLHRRRYDPRQSLPTWLFTIAANLTRNHHRWRSRHPESLMDPAAMSEADLPGHAKDSGEALSIAERSGAIGRAIARLPEDQRVALVLSVYEGLSHAEIAAITNSSAKATELRIYRARRELRQRLKAWLPDALVPVA